MYGSTLWKNFKARGCDGFRKESLLCLWDLKYSGDLVRITVTETTNISWLILTAIKQLGELLFIPGRDYYVIEKFMKARGRRKNAFIIII